MKQSLAKNIENQNKTKAVIYCRASSTKLTLKGDGLNSQKARCEEYANYKGYEVVQYFKDDMTGALFQRPGMQSMLSFLNKNSKETHVVIIDDISRLARDIETHLQLRSAISGAGGKLESPTLEFGEDPDSIFVENLLASVSQHQRQKNAEQTRNRMRARLLNGYWVFHAPVGYKYEKSNGGGKVLVRDEPAASILEEAFKLFASGVLQTKAEFKRYLDNQPGFPIHNATGKVLRQRIHEILTRVLYTGHLEVPNWNVSYRKANHEPLVSLEDFERIQKRLKTNAHAPARKDISKDFPLRGFVTCADCGQTMTACWSKGKSKHYPYYLCYTKGCPSRTKSIPRKKLEDAFSELVRKITPSKSLVNLAWDTLKIAWKDEEQKDKERTLTQNKQLNALDNQVSQLIDRIVETTNPTVAKAFEDKISNLEKEKALLSEKMEKNKKSRRGFEDIFEHCLDFFSNPHKLWASERLEDKRTVLKLMFLDKLSYDRNEGFRTPEISLPFNILRRNIMPKKEMVPRRGLEPPRPFDHQHLKLARLPIPPSGQAVGILLEAEIDNNKNIFLSVDKIL